MNSQLREHACVTRTWQAWALAALMVASAGATEPALDLPALTYKAPERILGPRWAASPESDPLSLGNAPVLPSPAVARKVPRHASRTMPILTPRPDIDFKLTIIDADPSIDPGMIVPLRWGVPLGRTRR